MSTHIPGTHIPAHDPVRALDPACSVVVEACAGSGKTWTLVSRLIRLLLDGVPQSGDFGRGETELAGTPNQVQPLLPGLLLGHPVAGAIR